MRSTPLWWATSLCVFAILPISSSSFALSPKVEGSAGTSKRSITRLAKDTYLIIHPDAPDSFPQSNTLVAIGSKSVFVVDSCYLPSAAREDIAQIKRWTNKPVRFLVNTHEHLDHNMGNGEYAAAFPGLKIISHSQTRYLMNGFLPPLVKNFNKRTEDLRQIAKTGIKDGEKIDEDLRKQYETVVGGRSAVYEEFSKWKLVLPNTIVDTRRTFDIGGRSVVVQFLGRGNTAGDLVISLPKDRIVATGDLVDYPVPYLGGGFPVEEIVTLGKLAQMNAKLYVPGHGAAFHGTGFIQTEREFLKQVVKAVQEAVFVVGGGGKKLEKVRAIVMKKLDIPLWTKRFGDSDKDSNEMFATFSLPGAIEAAYADIWRK